MTAAKPTPPPGRRYDSEYGKEAANARWAAERERRAELEQAAKDAAVQQYTEFLLKAATTVTDRLDADRDDIALRAAFDILDRHLGKALERHEHAGPEGSSLLRADIDPERLEVMLKEIAGLNGAGQNGDR